MARKCLDRTCVVKAYMDVTEHYQLKIDSHEASTTNRNKATESIKAFDTVKNFCKPMKNNKKDFFLKAYSLSLLQKAKRQQIEDCRLQIKGNKMNGECAMNDKEAEPQVLEAEEMELVAASVKRASFVPEFNDSECRMDVVWDAKDEENLKRVALVGGKPPVDLDTASINDDVTDDEIIEQAVACEAFAAPNSDSGVHVDEEELSSEVVERRVSVQELTDLLDGKLVVDGQPVLNGIAEEAGEKHPGQETDDNRNQPENNDENNIVASQEDPQKLSATSNGKNGNHKSKGFMGVFKRSPKPKRHADEANTTPESHAEHNGKNKDDKTTKNNKKKSGFLGISSLGKSKPGKRNSPDKTLSSSNVQNTVTSPVEIPTNSNEEIKQETSINISTSESTNTESKPEGTIGASIEIPTQTLTINSDIPKTESESLPTESPNISQVEVPEVIKPEIVAPSSPSKKNVEQVNKPSHSPGKFEPVQQVSLSVSPVVQPEHENKASKYMVVVAMDFGTAFSGYAFSFMRDPESIHMMSRWEGGDPGIINQKTPSVLLLDPQGQFHSFGFTARNHYHDLSPEDSVKWLYFDKFKMSLYKNQDCNRDTMIEAANGQKFRALDAARMTLAFFKSHALQELSDQCGTELINDDVKWIVTVPAIWNSAAKQFMRQAAYEAGLASSDNPDQLIIALEPEAASIHIRRLRLHMLVPDKPAPDLPLTLKRRSVDPTSFETVSSQFKTVSRYMVVDCGGGTVDITVHDVNAVTGQLHEVYKASGGAHGSCGIDSDFETLLCAIFGEDFISSYRHTRPSGWVALMLAFESRKRAANPFKVHQPLNIALPFSFIEYYRKTKNKTVEKALSEFGESELTWSSQGMLRMTTDAMRILFQTTLDGIIESIADIFKKVHGIQNIFLVGGLSESPIIQQAVRDKFGQQARVIVPQEANLAVLKGAVIYGLDPEVVAERRSKLTFGAAVLHRFIPNKHPQSHLVHCDGVDWCKDVFDQFVVVNQIVHKDEPVVRSYTPASSDQSVINITIYCTEHTDVQYVTDPRVRQCASITLALPKRSSRSATRRKIQTFMTFAETEIKITALDTSTGEKIHASLDFFST